MGRKSGFSEAQIVAVVREAEAGAKLGELARKNGVTVQTLARWRARFSGMNVSEVKEKKRLEEENAKLKKLVAQFAVRDGDRLAEGVPGKKVVAPSVRREVVRFLKSRGHTERRACVLASAQRSTCRYSKKKADDPKLLARLREIAEERPRFGYRRVHAILRREGFEVNRKRVYRIYRAAGLNVKRRSRRKLRAIRPMPNSSVTRPNERWSMDFVHDYLADRRKLRTFNVVDAFTRECLAIEVDTSLPARRIIAVLDKLVWIYGLPESLRVDNGPEFISAALEKWAHAHGVKLDFIQPGKPTQNAHIESFNGHFRDECLAQARFPTLARARVEIEEWRIDYNCERPHSSLDYRTPKAFGDIARSKVPPPAGAAAALLVGNLKGSGGARAREGVESRLEVN